MPNYAAGGVAGEDLIVSRVLTAGATANGSLSFTMADDNTVEPAGISAAGCQDAPGLSGTDETIATESGRPVMMYVRGDQAPCKVGATAVVAGARVKVNAANGLIGPLAGTEEGGTWTVGIALISGVATAIVPVKVDPLQIAVPDTIE